MVESEGRAFWGRKTVSILDYGAVPDGRTPATAAIQKALDGLGASGGGTVLIPAGTFLTGGLTLRSNIAVQIEKGATILGSSNYLDYGEGQWHEGLFAGDGLKNIAITGDGTIDGNLCSNPKGEAGFRGPHSITLSKCSGILVRGVTILRSGNYGFLLWDSTNAVLEKLTVHDPQDGIHTQACSRFIIRDCDLRTQDDAFAGCDNADFEITGCRLNSSCNIFRLGCVNLTVRKCTMWGPGVYAHGQRGMATRTNTLAVFTHFAPQDRNPKLMSDNWIVEDCTISDVDALYLYNFLSGTWQTGQPAKRIVFRNITATGLCRAVEVVGDSQRLLDLSFENVSLTFRPGADGQSHVVADSFGTITAEGVSMVNRSGIPALDLSHGNQVVLGGDTSARLTSIGSVIRNARV